MFAPTEHAQILGVSLTSAMSLDRDVCLHVCVSVGVCVCVSVGVCVATEHQISALVVIKIQ